MKTTAIARSVVAAAMAVATTSLAAPAVAGTAPPPTPAAIAPAPRAAPSAPDRVADPAHELEPGWQRSTDRAVTSSSDATGFHLLVADAADAYQWRTAASLAEPGFPTDQWIGQFCVTASGRRAVVVYAPREFANYAELMTGGAFAAVVDLTDGRVRKLPDRVSLAYYNPGCGAGETAVLSRRDTRPDGSEVTWAATVDTTTGHRLRPITTPGQVTSLLPYRGNIAGAMGRSLVSVGRSGGIRVLATTDGVPHRLLADGAGAIAFQVSHDRNVTLSRYADGRVTAVRKVPAGSVRLRPGAGGRVFAVGGDAQTRKALPTGWGGVDAPPDSDVSTEGALVVTRASTGREAAGHGGAPTAPGSLPVTIAASLTGTAKRLSFVATPGEKTVAATPAVAASVTVDPPVDAAHVPYDPDRACAVPRNDSSIQVYQPTPEQVEWAANLAVAGGLTFTRPANWKNNGMAAYSPQGTMFPPIPLLGGDHVPAQVLLGILAQESNMWQASWHIVDGSGGNPLTSMGFYGISSGDRLTARKINWSKADCGYGVGQLTTGMRKSDTGATIDGITWTYDRQKAVAQDYTANVAAALRNLQNKWNVTRSNGLIANNGSPVYIENWWFAIWAYNTGFYNIQGSSPWGVGWANNIANTDYPPDRRMFLQQKSTVPYGDPPRYDQDAYDNAKHPNHWTYPERVTGWAYTSLRRFDYDTRTWGDTYAPADNHNAQMAQAGNVNLYTFCKWEVNQCDETMPPKVPSQYPNTKAGACQRDDLKCWWHAPATWTDCPTYCGTEKRTFSPGDAEPAAGNKYPSPRNPDGTCKVTGLPSGSRIIDDIDVLSATGPEGCRPAYTKGGTFGLTFGSMTGPTGATIYPSKVDFHQTSSGFGGHTWFAHTMRPNDPNDNLTNDPLKVTGTWTINPTNAWTRLFVHLPDAAAWTRQADYTVTLPYGQVKHRVLPTRLEKNTWVSLGVFDFRGEASPTVTLSNFTRDGTYDSDIAWDAIAVQPLTAKPSHFVVGLGDSYSSGEGIGDYTRVSDQYGDESATRNACHRSDSAWARLVEIPSAPGGANVGQLADGLDPDMDFHFAACSGAVVGNVVRSRTDTGAEPPPLASGDAIRGQYGELTQLDQGWLDENTTLVTLTIGGNDLKWAQALEACAYASNCAAPGFTRDGDPLPLKYMMLQRIHGSVKTDTARLIGEIRDLAPHALIMLVGYPQLFVTGRSYAINDLPGLPPGLLISSEEVTFVNDMAGVLFTDLTVPVATGENIVAVDARPAFAGHELEWPPTAIPYLNPIWLPGDTFRLPDDDGEPSTSVKAPESGHPDIDGSKAYARAVSGRLRTFGYTW